MPACEEAEMDDMAILSVVIIAAVRVYQKYRNPSDEALPLAAIVLGVGAVYGYTYLPVSDRKLIADGIQIGLGAIGGYAGVKTLIKAKTKDGAAE